VGFKVMLFLEVRWLKHSLRRRHSFLTFRTAEGQAVPHSSGEVLRIDLARDKGVTKQPCDWPLAHARETPSRSLGSSCRSCSRLNFLSIEQRPSDRCRYYCCCILQRILLVHFTQKLAHLLISILPENLGLPHFTFNPSSMHLSLSGPVDASLGGK
jgi:hypothetical protein